MLNQWLVDNFENPYPSTEQRKELAERVGATDDRVQTFFTNARARVWKPHVQSLPGWSVTVDAVGRMRAERTGME